MKSSKSATKHLSWVRNLPCLVCGHWPPNQAHHILRDVDRGMGLKASDAYTLPLCMNCHSQLHLMGNERVFFERVGLDPLKWAARLVVLSGRDIAEDIQTELGDSWRSYHYSKVKEKLR